MAEVLTPLIKVIIENLASLLVEEFTLLKGVGREINGLSEALRRIEATLYDAETRQVTEKAVQLWLSDLKDVAYEADDIIDEFATELLRSKTIEDGNSSLNNQVRRFSPFLCFRQVKSSHEIGRKIKAIRKKIDEIETYGSRLNLRVGAGEKKILSKERPQTDSVLTEPAVYGRDEDKSNIIEMLLAPGCGKEDISVIPLVGMGGLGKTTLAQLAYNDERVEKHFDIRIWICVSDDFDVKRLIRVIIESTTKKECGLSEMDTLQSRLKDELKGWRFLLVLDDVWKEANGMRDKWNKMRTHLGSGAKGSKVIVTTRFQEVAIITGTTTPYPVKGLSENDCLSLFERWAFGDEGWEAYPNLSAIGREIVRKCGGVPLAAKALGSLMWLKREESEWCFVRDSELWNLSEDENGILPALRLSYDDLPSHLKRCFAYCSIFPKDHEFVKETLIQQWIAVGFIQSSQGSRPTEDIGNEYFNDLLQRSFFQDVVKDDFGDITKCKMHDLIHDLAQLVAGGECLIFRAGTETSTSKGFFYPSKRSRHSSMVVEDGKIIISEALCEAKHLRTLLLRPLNYCPYPSHSSYEMLDKMFSTFRFLRVLSLNCGGIDKFPESIGKLIHLRYLDLSFTKITALPESISSLQNLQTLKLNFSIEQLPEKISCLISLRHLDIKRSECLTHMPAKIGELCDLQNLDRFIVRTKERCGIGELSGLNLRGSIKIEEIENVSNLIDAKGAKLKDKRNLRMLGLYWSKDKSLDGNANRLQNVEEVLEGLQPHQNLKKLWVSNYSGNYFSRWLMDSLLPNLVEILLHNCERCDLLPPLGQLPSLKILILDGLNAVRYLGREFYGNGTIRGFPSLNKLILINMPNLEVWSVGENLLPCLEELIVAWCPKLTSMPRFSSIRRLQLFESNNMILESVVGLVTLSCLGIYFFRGLKLLPEGMLENNTCLESLVIEGCHDLTLFLSDIENLTTLKRLAIFNCSDLQCLPGGFQSLTSLESLTIDGCYNLISFPDDGMQCLTSLQNLMIHDCLKLTSLPQGIKYLTSLKYLTIKRLPELVSFPEELQHLTNLKSLVIGGCDRFTYLPDWLGNLTSLRSLKIQNFRHLSCFPMWLQHLSMLQHLVISGCPHLVEQYEKFTREDQHKLAHIPDVKISPIQELMLWFHPSRVRSTMLPKCDFFSNYRTRTC